jgi:alkylation response protein AidB-like acyl-CoA dehydrogenase
MNTPGIVVRPIIGIENGHSLNEVFLTDVRVPVANLIGQENMGWTYAKELLAEERTFSAEVPRCKGVLARARMIARETKVRGKPLIEDPHFARRLAQLEIELIAHATTLERSIAEEEANMHAAVPTSSILKVRGTELMQKIGSLAIEALGDNALPEYPEHDYFLNPPPNHAGSAQAIGVVSDALYRRAMTIYGGSNEVQRNIIAAQLLRA